MPLQIRKNLKLEPLQHGHDCFVRACAKSTVLEVWVFFVRSRQTQYCSHAPLHSTSWRRQSKKAFGQRAVWSVEHLKLTSQTRALAQQFTNVGYGRHQKALSIFWKLLHQCCTEHQPPSSDLPSLPPTSSSSFSSFPLRPRSRPPTHHLNLTNFHKTRDPQAPLQHHHLAHPGGQFRRVNLTHSLESNGEVSCRGFPRTALKKMSKWELMTVWSQLVATLTPALTCRSANCYVILVPSLRCPGIQRTSSPRYRSLKCVTALTSCSSFPISRVLLHSCGRALCAWDFPCAQGETAVHAGEGGSIVTSSNL